MSTLQTGAVARFAEDLDSLSAHELVAEARRLLDAVKVADADNVTKALASPRFPFEEEQSVLERDLRELGCLLRAALVRRLPPVVAGELEDIAVLAERVPVTSRASLEVVRLSMEHIRARQRAASA